MTLEPPGAAGPPSAPVQPRQGFHIFINYRREETSAYAGRLYDALAERFGGDRVFMDIDAIHPGEDFAEVVESKVGACDVLLALIGRDWLRVKDAHGHDRLAKPHDWVRMEIETALERKDTRVIPVLVQGAEMPSPDELPAPLRRLSVRNAVALSDLRWRTDVGSLVGYLEELAGPAMQTRTREPATKGRRPWLLAALVGAVVLVGALVATVVLTGGGSGKKEEARYVRQTDSLLNHSADTRGDLGGLRDRVAAQPPQISRDDALAEIGQIIGKRRTLADSLPVEPPSAFRHAQTVLRDSIVISLRDDQATQRWIVAVFDHSFNAAGLATQFKRLDGMASAKKEDFLDEYNALRRKRLGLGAIHPLY